MNAFNIGFGLTLIVLTISFACVREQQIGETSELIPERTIDNIDDTIFFRQMGHVLYKDQKFFLLNSDNRDVIICDENFKYINLLSKRGRGPGEYMYPTDINLDNNGNLVLKDYNSIFKVYDVQTNFIKKVEVNTESSYGRFIIDENNVFYTSCINTYFPIMKFDLNGDTISGFGVRYNYSGGTFFKIRCQSRHLFLTDDKNILAIGQVIPSVELYRPNGTLIFQETIDFPQIQENFELNYSKVKDSPNSIVHLYADVYYFNNFIYLLYVERLDTKDRVNLDNLVVYKVNSKGIELYKIYNFLNDNSEENLITCICICDRNKLVAYNHLKGQFQFYSLK